MLQRKISQKDKYSQLFIEGEGNYLHIFIYLKDFSKKFAAKVMDSYIKKFKDNNFEGIYLTFWDKYIAGDFLRYYKYNSTDKNVIKPIIGTKVFKARYDFTNSASDKISQGLIEDMVVIS